MCWAVSKVHYHTYKTIMMVNAAFRVSVLVLLASLLTTQKISAQEECVETDISERLSQAEDRVSRLEDRLYSVLTESETQCNSSNDTLVLLEMVERLADVAKSLENMSVSNDASEEDKVQPVCERGIAGQVTEPFLLLDNSVLNRQIRCDTQTDEGGWIVFQRRASGNVDFYRNWAAYRDGFGDLNGDFWLGNQALHTLTSSTNYELRIDVHFGGQHFYAHFSSIRVDNESEKFRLRLGTYSGDVGGVAGMIYNNNQPFTTFDQDNDGTSSNCAELRHGAWWYRACTHVNLNGQWGVQQLGGMRWYNGGVNRYASFSEMKIRVV